jgi:hypothetical protein
MRLLDTTANSYYNNLRDAAEGHLIVSSERNPERGVSILDNF